MRFRRPRWPTGGNDEYEDPFQDESGGGGGGGGGGGNSGSGSSGDGNSGSGSSGSGSGVAGTTAQTDTDGSGSDDSGSLPLTGLPLAGMVLVATAMIAGGYTLKRRAEAPTRVLGDERQRRALAACPGRRGGRASSGFQRLDGAAAADGTATNDLADAPVVIDARAAVRREIGGVERVTLEMAARLPLLCPDRYSVMRPAADVRPPGGTPVGAGGCRRSRPVGPESCTAPPTSLRARRDATWWSSTTWRRCAIQAGTPPPSPPTSATCCRCWPTGHGG